MQPRHAAAAAAAAALLGTLLAGGAFGPPRAAAQQPTQVAVCPSSEKAQQVVQNPGGALPDGCRVVTVMRRETPAGQLCGVDFGQVETGLLGDIVDAAVATRWWAACANLPLP